MRWPSFDQSVIDHDESTYIVIGQAVWRGELLYTDVWDTKPAGIFLLFGFILKLFGGSIFTIRMLATVAITLTSLCLYQAKRCWGHSWSESILSGALCVMMCSAYRFGLPAHIELFFMPCVAAALWILIARDTLMSATLAGLVLGLGFIVKYVILFDIIPLALIFFIRPLWNAWRDDRDHLRVHLRRATFFVCAAALPFASLHLAFALTGNFDDFYQATYVIPRRYVSSGNAEVFWRMIKRFHYDYIWVLIPFYLSLSWSLMNTIRPANHRGLTSTYSSRRVEVLFGALWYLSVWVSVLIPGKPFTHYFLQLSLPTAFLAPRILSKLAVPWLQRSAFIMIALFMMGYAGQRASEHHRVYHNRVDVPREVAAYLRPKLKPHDRIYTANFDHILYHLLELDSPTKYVHRSLLTNPQHLKTLALDPLDELAHILRQKPRFILTVNRYRHRALNEALRRDYRRLKVFYRRYHVYERK